MDRYLKTHLRLFNEEQMRSLRAVDVFDELIRFLRMFIAFCGSDVLLMENFRWNGRTWFCLFALVSYALSLIYTISKHSDDWLSIMDTLSVSGIAFQGMIKMYSGLSRVEFFQNVYLGLRTVHAKSSCNPENNYVMLKCVLHILYVFRLFLVAYFLGGSAFFVAPLYTNLILREKMLIINIELPFVDIRNDLGFMITIFYQILLVAFAIAGILAADMAVMTIVIHTAGFVDVFRNTLRELDHLLELPQRDEEEIHEKVTEICKMHREILRYEEDLDDHYHATVFVQVITSVLCLSISLFLVYVRMEVAWAMFIMATLFQLAEFCVLGTVLTYKNDQALIAIYDFKWYLLQRSDQNKLLIMLHRAQNPVEMTIGGLALLNMETFVTIMKTIYSYFAMLITFFEP